ncbi:hypothetical protein HYW17_05045 [Candidatus Uhrbacteria bacterium]|nr:hypothetical protein [Candidatus Uhrbacteria bacterium]
MRTHQLPVSVPGATHFVCMDEGERPPVDDVIAFARANGATTRVDGEEMLLVRLYDEDTFCGMNRHSLNAGLTE